MTRITRRGFFKLTAATTVGTALAGVGCAALSNTQKPLPKDLRIALYLDDGTWDTCRKATPKMLNWLGCAYDTLTPSTVSDLSVEHHHVLVMPGGNMGIYAQNLGDKGMQRIEAYVKQGGGYVGICGGAYFAARQWVWQGWSGEQLNIIQPSLGLFAGQAAGPINDFAPTYVQLCRLDVVQPDHPINQTGPDVYWMSYQHGPQFIPDNPATLTALCKTEVGAHALLATCTYGSGRVYLSSTHPEFPASNDNEDDVTYPNWEYLERAMLWCGKMI